MIFDVGVDLAAAFELLVLLIVLLLTGDATSL